LIKGFISAGYHALDWNGRDEAGQLVASGIYFYRLEAKAKDMASQPFMDVKKMILMK
jgi:flagellar hook assembly protein FlgD